MHVWDNAARERQGFSIAPPSKPVVVNPILLHEQVARLSLADLTECTEWLDTTIGWGGEEITEPNMRIRVSGDPILDDAVVHEHKLYNATGSIEAQARIDSYIIPCMVCRIFGKPFEKQGIRNKIPGYMWSELIRRTDPVDVLRYHSLPDLGVYIRGRMMSQSTWVPTHQATQPNLNGGGGDINIGGGGDINIGGGRTSSTLAPRGGGGGGTKSSSMLCVTAFLHSCCSVTAPQARSDANNADQSSQMDATVSMPDSCTSVGCLHGSIISLIMGSVMPMCRRSSQCRRLHPTHSQVRSAVSCCTLMEFTTLCSLVCALLLGLYPRGRKTAIFDVRVTIYTRMRELVTSGYNMEARRSFLLGCLPILQLAVAEYLYNFLQDYMPVEAKVLGIERSSSTGYSTVCDQFREKCIQTGGESWGVLSTAASTHMDKLVRNTRVCAGKMAQHDDTTTACTQAKKRRSTSSFQYSTGKFSLGPSHGDVVMVNQWAMGDNHSSPSISNHPPLICMPEVPIRPVLLDMHVCYTDNLCRLYPSIRATPHELKLVHALHQRICIRRLPQDISMEQQSVLDLRYHSDTVMSSAVRSMYICTSCALAGRATPLRQPMRYSMLNQRFTCMTCHRQQRAKGQQQQRRDKGAKLTSNDTSIICIDMIGKVKKAASIKS